MLDSELTFSHHINLIARKLSATSASGGFPISHPPIQTHPCPRICNPAVLTAAVLCWLGFLLVPWLGWTEFCVWLPVLLGGCPSFLPLLPTCVMYSIGCLYLSGYSIASLQWSPVVSLAAPPLTSASSAAQCRFWLHVGCCVLLRGVSFWSLVPVWLLCSEGPFRLWVHQHGMISPLSCVPC